MPSGLAFRDGALYVAEVSRILRFRDVARDLARPPEARGRLSDAYPVRHAPRLEVHRLRPGRPPLRPGRRAVQCLSAARAAPRHDHPPRPRPAAGPRWWPAACATAWASTSSRSTGELWFTDNGRDWLGDDQPPDELNRSDAPGGALRLPLLPRRRHPRPGLQRRTRLRPVHRARPACSGPHVAALGMRFYTGRMFPEKYRGGIFIAEHGSWNRSTPSATA